MIVRMSKLIYLGVMLSLVSICVYSQANTVDSATSLFDSGDPQTRRDALSHLAGVDDQRANDRLFLALNDPDNLIREIAAGAVANHPYRDVVPALILSLRDTDKMVMYRAAESLTRLGDDRAVVPLIDALGRSTDRTCDYPVVQALGKFHDPRSVLPLFGYLDKECGSAVYDAMGTVAIEPMVEIIKHGTTLERGRAVNVLNNIRDERSVEALISLINDNDTRLYAVGALVWRTATKSAIEPLRAAFSDPNREIKRSAVQALSRISDDEAAQALLDLASDRKQQMWARVLLTESLISEKRNQSGINKDRFIRPLLVLVDDPDPYVSNVAIRGLSDEKGEDVLAAMIAAMPDPGRTAEASIAVGSRKDIRALPYLVASMKSYDFGGIRFAQVLASFGRPAVDGLISILSDKNPDFPRREGEMRRNERNSIPHCGVEGPRPNYDPRFHAAWALGEIGDEQAREPLSLALKDKAIWIRQAAAAALLKINKERSLRH